MADEWVDVPSTSTTPPPANDGWVDVPQHDTAPDQPSALDQFGRGVGLGARAVVQGAADVGGILYDPAAFLWNKAKEGANAVLGTDFQSTPRLHDQAAAALDAAGVPKPETTWERVRGAAGEGAAAGMASVGAGSAMQAAKEAPAIVPKVGEFLAAGPAQQIVGGASAGAGGQTARELGAPGWVQFLTALGAGVAGAKATDAMVNAATPVAAVPSTKQLKDQAGAAYQRAEDAGAIVAPEAVQRLSHDINADLAEFGYHPNLQPRVGTVLGEIQRIASDNITTKGMMVLRRLARNAAQSNDPSERMLGDKIIEHIDDFVNSLQPQDIVQGDAAEAASAWQQGRELWARMRKAEMIDDAVTRATDRAASTNSGGNLQNTIRQNLRSILDSPSKRRMFTPEELAAIRAIVRGTASENALRLVGRLAPSSNAPFGIMTTLVGSMAGGAPGSMAGASIPLVGAGSKSIANYLTNRRINSLGEFVRSGGESGGFTVTPEDQAALARILGQSATALEGQPATAAAPRQEVTAPVGHSEGGVVTKPSLKEFLDSDVQHFAKGGVVLNSEAEKGTIPASKSAPNDTLSGTRHSPIKVDHPDHAAMAGKKIADASPDQKEAGNYQKGHLTWNGLSITLEIPKGGTRKAKDGSWEVKDFPAHYGYIKRTVGADAEHVDVFFGDHPDSKRVWIVDQIDPKTGKFDEHKCLLACSNPKQARDLYASAFTNGSGSSRIGAFTMMPLDRFKAWLKRGKRTKPVGKLPAPKA